MAHDFRVLRCKHLKPVRRKECRKRNLCSQMKTVGQVRCQSQALGCLLIVRALT